MVSVTVLVIVIVSLDLAIDNPVPTAITTSSVPLPEPPAVNLIFSEAESSPSTAETLYVVSAPDIVPHSRLVGVEAFAFNTSPAVGASAGKDIV